MGVATDRLLLLATTNSYRANAFLEAARGLGVPVTVGSERRQALEALHPQGHLVLPFRDPGRALARVEAFAAREPVAGVLACDDEGVELAALVSRALGLPGNPPEAAARARSKRLTREALDAAGLPQPGHRVLRAREDPASLAEEVRYPCVVKPLRLSASRGVMRADDPAALIAACRRLRALLARPGLSAGAEGGDVLIEDFVPGPEVALEGLLTAGRMRTLALFDKPDPLDGPFFEETIYVTPSRHPAALGEAAVAMTARAVAALGLTHGAIHAELRLGPAAPVPLEIAPRSIGGLCSRALRFEGGASLETLLVRHALGLPGADAERERAASGVMMLPIPRAGVLRGITGLDRARSVPGIDEVIPSIPVGQPVEPAPEGNRYLGFAFARGADPGAVEASLRAAHGALSFDIQPPD